FVLMRTTNRQTAPVSPLTLQTWLVEAVVKTTYVMHYE
ncbi:hypothetical protein VCHENC02_1611B, partial [Vibrio harveyi]